MAAELKRGSDICAVLLTEDDPGFARLVQKNLVRCGLDASIHWLPNGKELLSYLEGKRGEVAAQETRYVVLLDLAMPVMDGLQALQRLKKDKDLKRIPVIVLTTSAAPEEKERCFGLGCEAFLVKPPDFCGLTDAVAAILKPAATILGDGI